MPDYEEAIAQSMKHPPPPYYQVAMASDQVTSNMNENQLAQSRTTTHIVLPSIVQNMNSEHGVPPAYNDEGGDIVISSSETQIRPSAASSIRSNDSIATTNETEVTSLQRPQN